MPHVRKIWPLVEGLLAKQEQEQGQGVQGQRWQEGKDVYLKCGQRGHWAKNCPNPAKAIHGLDKQNDAGNGWWQWGGDCHEWAGGAAESQRAAPTQPVAEPEAAMGGLWLASLTAGAESEESCETNPAAELMSLEGRTAERITFGVDSGAALTVIGKDVAAEYPRVQGFTRRVTDCQGNPVVDLGQKDLALRRPTCRSFARVTVASVAKNLLSVSSLLQTGHEVVFSSGKSYISGI